MTKPKYFVVKKDIQNPLWEEYIKWLNKTYNKNYLGNNRFYGYDGTSFLSSEYLTSFKNNPILLTLQQWKEVFINENLMYKGDLEDFPVEIVEKMLEKQVEQGNKKDVSIFEKYRCSAKSLGGFNWEETCESLDFWYSILVNKNFDTFYALYQKKEFIGYRAPYDLFKGRIKKGDIFSLYSADKFVMYNEKHKTSGIPTEIVHKWEKVYEEDEIKFGDYKVEFGNNTIKVFDVYYTISQLNSLKHLMKKGQIKSLNCGCQGQYKVDLDLIEKIIRKLSNKN